MIMEHLSGQSWFVRTRHGSTIMHGSGFRVLLLGTLCRPFGRNFLKAVGDWSQR